MLINRKKIAEDGLPPESAKDADRTSRIARLLKCHFERINGGKLDAIATCLCVLFGELSCSVRSEESIATILSQCRAPFARQLHSAGEPWRREPFLPDG
jgi:hypothetical protein